VKRIFNGKPAAQPHTGTDYAISADTPVVAVANDKVVIAEDLFFPSNVVFIDHGDGLITMSFHLSEITVHTNTFTNCRYDRTHSHLIPLKGQYWVTCNGAQ
jgi:murein DD-endopeptidase MepM/ murein hydrolase activator NlpD